MAIQFIDNQPIYFTGDLPTASPCKATSGCDDYCALYQTNDPVQFQFKLTEDDATNLFCNADFTNTNANLVTNGEFNTNTGWTFGTGWAYNSVDKWAYRTSTSSGTLSYYISGLAATRTYIVEFKINTVMAWNNPVYVQLGGSAVGNVRIPGTYKLYVVTGGAVSGGTVTFSSTDNGLYIDNVKVYESIVQQDTTACLYTATANQSITWLNDGASLTHVTGLGTDNTLFTNVIFPQVAGYMKFSVNISNFSGDPMDVKIYNCTGASPVVTIGTITGNGIWEFYFGYSLTTASTQITFGPTLATYVTISNISVLDLTLDSAIFLKNLANNSLTDITTIGGIINYEKEYVSIRIPPGHISPGQYRFCVYDFGGTNLNQDMIIDWDFAIQDWTLPGINLSLDNITANLLTIGLRFDYYTYNFFPNSWEGQFLTNIVGHYRYEFQTSNIDVSGNVLTLLNAADNSLITILGMNLLPNTTYSGTFFMSANPAGMIPIFSFTQSGMDKVPGEGVFQLKYMKIRLISAYPDTANETCSNCIDVRDVHKCSHWVSGDCDQSAFGFDFTTFAIEGRVKSMFLNPKYRGEFNRYDDAEGRATVTRATSNKIYQFLIDYAPERLHDWLRLAVLCDTIHIGSAWNATTEWINTEGNYEPEWPDPLGNFQLAQAKLELQQKTDEKFNNNAG